MNHQKIKHVWGPTIRASLQPLTTKMGLREVNCFSSVQGLAYLAPPTTTTREEAGHLNSKLILGHEPGKRCVEID